VGLLLPFELPGDSEREVAVLATPVRVAAAMTACKDLLARDFPPPRLVSISA
jgi:hypothetical protein